MTDEEKRAHLISRGYTTADDGHTFRRPVAGNPSEEYVVRFPYDDRYRVDQFGRNIEVRQIRW